MPKHTVKQGESLAGIAKHHGLGNWRAVYHHPENAALRAARPNPNLLHPGDIVFLPEKKEKRVAAGTGARHHYKVHTPRQVLRLALEGEDGGRLADADYELVVDDKAYPAGRTDGRGMLEVRIPRDARRGKLTIGDYVWELGIARLDPIDAGTPNKGVSGAQGRLHNLGFNTGPIDGVLGKKTRAALKRFQAEARLAVTGELDEPTRRALVAAHGC